MFCYANPYDKSCPCYCEVNEDCAICGTGCPLSQPVVSNPGGGTNPKLPEAAAALIYRPITTTFYNGNYDPNRPISADNPFYSTNSLLNKGGFTATYQDENGLNVSIGKARPDKKQNGQNKKGPRSLDFTDGTQASGNGLISDNLANGQNSLNGNGSGQTVENLQVTGVKLDVQPRPGLQYGKVEADFQIGNITVPANAVAVKTGKGVIAFFDANTGKLIAETKASNLPKSTKKNNIDFSPYKVTEDASNTTNGLVRTQFSTSELFPGVSAEDSVLFFAGIQNHYTNDIQTKVALPKGKSKTAKKIFSEFKKNNLTYKDKTLIVDVASSYGELLENTANASGNSAAFKNFLARKQADSFDSYLASVINGLVSDRKASGAKAPTSAEIQAALKNALLDATGAATGGNTNLVEKVDENFDQKAELLEKTNPYSDELRPYDEARYNEMFELNTQREEKFAIQKKLKDLKKPANKKKVESVKQTLKKQAQNEKLIAKLQEKINKANAKGNSKAAAKLLAQLNKAGEKAVNLSSKLDSEKAQDVKDYLNQKDNLKTEKKGIQKEINQSKKEFKQALNDFNRVKKGKEPKPHKNSNNNQKVANKKIKNSKSTNTNVVKVDPTNRKIMFSTKNASASYKSIAAAIPVVVAKAPSPKKAQKQAKQAYQKAVKQAYVPPAPPVVRVAPAPVRVVVSRPAPAPARSGGRRRR